jgi:hypothetical protein
VAKSPCSITEEADRSFSQGALVKAITTHSWMKKIENDINTKQMEKVFGRLNRYFMLPEWVTRIRYKAIAAEYCKDNVLLLIKYEPYMKLCLLF